MLTKLNALREAREEGFTLIELLVVILIIGILAAIAIPVFLNQRKTANDGAVESDVKNAATQVETWVTEQGSAVTPVPSNLSELDVKTSTGVTLSVTGDSNAFCILGYHENGKNYVSTSAAATYDSGAGGLNRDGGACPEGVSNEDGESPDTGTTPEDGTGTTPAPGSEMDMTYGSFGIQNGAEQYRVAADSTWSSSGAINTTFVASSTAAFGYVEWDYQYYCGTTPADFGSGSTSGNFENGSIMMITPTPNTDCAVTGVTFSSSEWSPWIIIEGTTPIINISGTAPVNDGGSGETGDGTYAELSAYHGSVDVGNGVTVNDLSITRDIGGGLSISGIIVGDSTGVVTVFIDGTEYTFTTYDGQGFQEFGLDGSMLNGVTGSISFTGDAGTSYSGTF